MENNPMFSVLPFPRSNKNIDHKHLKEKNNNNPQIVLDLVLLNIVLFPILTTCNHISYVLRTMIPVQMFGLKPKFNFYLLKVLVSVLEIW